jgi:phosphosulfolactate synthase
LSAFEKVVSPPLPGRMKKPRETGLTMVIDKGLGLRETRDLVETCDDHVDIVKLGFGTSRLCPMEIIKKKVATYKAHDVYVMPGGTLLEVAVAQKVLDGYLAEAKRIGFNAIEVSDGTVPMRDEVRAHVVREACSQGFKVVAEVGRKFKELDLSPEEFVKGVKRDLELGAWKVIIEAREAGRGVGIYDDTGRIVKERFERIVSGLLSVDDIIFEAPEKSQQVELIQKFGPNVNLGNIPPAEALSVEALRNGLRADTLRKIYGKG